MKMVKIHTGGHSLNQFVGMACKFGRYRELGLGDKTNREMTISAV